MREVWKSVLAFLKNTIPEEVFVPWFGKVEFTEDSEPDIINISVPSVPHSKFIKAQYEKDIEEKAVIMQSGSEEYNEIINYLVKYYTLENTINEQDNLYQYFDEFERK